MKKLASLTQFKRIPLFLFSILAIFLVFAFSNAIIKTPTVSVAADKMNLFYIGIDNPITVAVAGFPSEKVKVSCEDAEIENLGDGHFNVRINTIGKKIIKVEADGIPTQEIEYRVRRIPDPTSILGFSTGGKMRVYDFKQQTKVDVNLFGLPLEEKCIIQSFEFTRQRKGFNPLSMANVGADFNKEMLLLIEDAQSGDVYYFDRIRCICPGDPAAQNINSMVFKNLHSTHKCNFLNRTKKGT